MRDSLAAEATGSSHSFTLRSMIEPTLLLLRLAARLCGATVAWNLTVGGAAVATALVSGSLSLIGFGINGRGGLVGVVASRVAVSHRGARAR